MKPIPLEYGFNYHVFNRGVDKRDIFLNSKDYEHFLHLYRIFIAPIAKTFAWSLLKNHFHFLIQLKQHDEIGYLNPAAKNETNVAVKWKLFFPDDDYPSKKTTKLVRPKPHRMFSHFFNAYSQYFNKKYDRKGKLLEQPFERISIASEKHFYNLIPYINYNAIRHNFVLEIEDYPWTSYHEALSDEPGIIARDEVLEWYGGINNFIASHKNSKYGELKDYELEYNPDQNP